MPVSGAGTVSGVGTGVARRGGGGLRARPTAGARCPVDSPGTGDPEATGPGDEDGTTATGDGDGRRRRIQEAGGPGSGQEAHGHHGDDDRAHDVAIQTAAPCCQPTRRCMQIPGRASRSRDPAAGRWGRIRSGRRIAELAAVCAWAPGSDRVTAARGSRATRVGVGSARDPPVTRDARGQTRCPTRRPTTRRSRPSARASGRPRRPRSRTSSASWRPTPTRSRRCPMPARRRPKAARRRPEPPRRHPRPARPRPPKARRRTRQRRRRRPTTRRRPPRPRTPATRRPDRPGPELPDTVLRVERGGIGQATAGSVEVHLGGIGALEARTCSSSGAASAPPAPTPLSVEFGSVGASLGRRGAPHPGLRRRRSRRARRPSSRASSAR